MPSSRPISIPTVIHLLRQLKPQSILDVGIGFGKWGHLFREYTDILESENDPARYERKNWQIQIDGIEGFPAYVTDMHRFIYNEIHLGNACDLIPKLPSYDLIFLGDIIEHLEKKTGLQLLGQALEKAGKAVIVSTPKDETYQEDLCGNELERHRSLWSARDFKRFPTAHVTTIGGSLLLAMLLKPGIPVPSFRAVRPARPQDLDRLQEARRMLIQKIPTDEPFILVDEEQIRSSLPHTRIVPFLEKNGAWWGPPPDEATAVSELKRLRGAGAKHIAFIWSTAWWLEHYKALHDFLQTDCPLLYSGPAVKIFIL
jgi:SAM-dependent methyltransferase